MLDIIVNPLGGKGKTAKALIKVEKILKEKGVEYTVHKTEYAGHATIIASELSRKPNTDIVVMGGDGSFHEVLCGIENFENVTLGIIACGSGNDFIKKSGHPSKIEDALDVILRGDKGYVDFIELGKYRCLNVAGAGMDVDVLVKYAGCRRLKGKAAYYYALFYTLAHTRFHHLKMTVDGIEMDKSVFMIGIGNGGFIGGGIPICPDAVVNDGLLSVVICGELKKSQILPTLPKLLSGKHVQMEFTEVFSAKEVTVECLDDSRFELDGEIVDDKVLNMKIVYKTLKVFK